MSCGVAGVAGTHTDAESHSRHMDTQLDAHDTRTESCKYEKKQALTHTSVACTHRWALACVHR